MIVTARWNNDDTIFLDLQLYGGNGVYTKVGNNTGCNLQRTPVQCMKVHGYVKKFTLF